MVNYTLPSGHTRLGPMNPNLKTFTIIGWISTSRNITTPYNLVFRLTLANNKITGHQAKDVWNDIAKNTLKGDNLTKFLQHIDGDKD
jgi:hypothetical protein